MRAAGRLALTLVAALAATAAVAWWLTGSPLGPFAPDASGARLSVNGEWVEVPAPADNPARLLPVVETTEHGAYSFAHLAGGEPVRFDPCLPVRWRLSTADMPVGGEDLVRDAVAEISTRTGLQWEFVGYTGLAPTDSPEWLEQIDGEWVWSPVVVGWSDAARTPGLAGESTGLAGPVLGPAADGDDTYLRTGAVFIDIDDLPHSLTRDADRDRAYLVLIHELAHVVGLDHVADTGELMFPSVVGKTGWGPGDLAGLAQAGAGRCEGQQEG